MILKDTTLKKTQMTSKYFKVFETSTSLASRKCNIKLLWYSFYHQQKKSGGGGRQDLIQSLWEGAEVILAVNKVATETIENRIKIWPSCVVLDIAWRLLLSHRRDIWTPMFVAAAPTVAEKWNSLDAHPSDEHRNKRWGAETKEFYQL